MDFWIAITRPDNLVLALAAAGGARGRFSRCHLLYEDSAWWRHARWDAYRPIFDSVTPVAKIPTCRGLLDMPRFARQLAARQRQLAELRIAPDDVIFTLAGITSLSNALASAYPRVFKIFGLTLKKYLDASRPADFRRYRHTTSGWLQNRFLEPRAGVGRTLHLKPWINRGGDGVRLERLQAPLEAVFERLLILSNTGTELPPAADPRLQPAPFPNLRELSRFLPVAGGGRTARRSAIFFGTPFLLVRNLSPATYAEHVDACLDYLRRHHGEHCRLVYRPHPAETTERDRLRLDGFEVENDQEVAEIYFLKNAAGITAVYSVSSTVSRVAYNYGLNAYALWRCFPFADSAAAYFVTLMGVVPAEFDIAALDVAPVAYADVPARERGRTFADALSGALPPGEFSLKADGDGSLCRP